MFFLIFAILMGLACPKHTNTPNNGDTTITTYGDEDPDDDTGGQTSQTPPR